MNRKIMETLGFQAEIEEVSLGKCPFCHEQINENSFRDSLSMKEYTISGLCQNCQDKIFGGEG